MKHRRHRQRQSLAASRLGQAVAVCLLLLLAACSRLPENVSRIPSHALPVDPDSSLASNLQPLLRQQPGKSGFHNLAQGEEAFAARLQLVAAARTSIDVQYYIWHNDLTGRVLHNALLQAADHGVRVRLLLDDLDTAGKDQLLRTIDAHPNVQIRVFNPFANRDMRLGDFLGDTRRVNRRMHNKTMTADSLVTIFGGRNIGDEYFDATEHVAFGDMDAIAVGPIAQEVSAQFDLYWNSSYAYPIDAFDWDSPISEVEFSAYRDESDAFFEQAKKSRYARILRQVEFFKAGNISDIPFVWSDWHLAFDQPRAIEMNEITLDTHLAAKVIEAMKAAEEDLVIVSPYFVPGEAFTEFLVERVRQGVRVRILTNSLQANDVSLVHAGYMRYREDLVRGGVELYEFRSTSNKVRRRMERERLDVKKTSLHAKFFTFDHTWVFVGSFNLDGRSAKLNTELGAYFASPGEATALSDNFDDIMSALAYRIVINDRGDLEWVGVEGGEEIRFDHEPDTTWWKRVSTGILSWIVPESQL